MLKKLFYLSVFTLSLGQLASLFKQSTFNLYAFDLIVGVFAVYGMVYFLVVKKSFVIPLAFVSFVFFTFVAAISLLAAGFSLSFFEVASSAFYLVRWVVYLTAGLIIFNMLKNKILTTNEVFSTLAISGLLIAVLGFVQMVILPDFEALDPSLGWDPHKNRLASTFFDPNFTGAYLVLILSLFYEAYFYKKKGSERKIAGLGERNALLFLIILIAMFLTFSRSTWGMFAVVIMVYGLLKSRTLLVVSLIVAFSTYFAVPRIQTRLAGVTDPADSARFRLISWQNTSEIILDNLFLGVGFNTFRYAQREYGLLTPDTFLGHSGAGSDSSILLVLATTGVIGLFIFGVGLFLPVLRAMYERRGYWVLIIAVSLGLFLESQFINSLFYPQIMFVWFSILSIYSFSRI